MIIVQIILIGLFIWALIGAVAHQFSRWCDLEALKLSNGFRNRYAVIMLLSGLAIVLSFK